MLPSGQRVWVPEDNPRARDIGINCNSLDLSKLPGYDSRSYRWANSQETYNDLFSGWWEQGYSKKECDLKARKSWYEKIQSDRDNEVSYHYILVDVFYDLTGNGDTIEVASESLGGVDNTDDYLLTSIKEVCDTALASAKEKLPELLGKIRARLDATGLVTQTQGGP